MSTQLLANLPGYTALLNRHFRLTGPVLAHGSIMDKCIKKHMVYKSFIQECTPLFSVEKGVFAEVASVVIFISNEGDVYPVSLGPQGIPAAMFRSHAFIDRADILTSPNDFLDDAGQTFPAVRDWAAHTGEAKKIIQARYDIVHLDDF